MLSSLNSSMLSSAAVRHSFKYICSIPHQSKHTTSNLSWAVGARSLSTATSDLTTDLTVNRDRVETTIGNDGIARVVLNRPNKLNACDLAMFEAVAETAAKLREDRSLRAVLVSGKGRAFCTGLDVVSVIGYERT